MAVKIPDPIRRRDILYSERTSPEELSKYGRTLLEQERPWDALEFFGIAKDEEGLRRVRDAATEIGDSYLLRRIERVSPGMVQPQDWVKLGEQAWELEKYRDALEGFTRGGDQDRRAQAEAKVAEAMPQAEEQPGAVMEEQGAEAPDEEEGED